MKILKKIQNMNMTRAKTLALAGLMGLSACKFVDEPAQTRGADVEPEKTEQTETSSGPFMSHVANLETAKFYRPAIYNGHFRFETNVKGDVSKVIDSYAPDPEVSYYQTERSRRDAGSKGGTAYFETGEKEFRFILKEQYQGEGVVHATIWELHRIPESKQKEIDQVTSQLTDIAKTNGCNNAVLKGLKYNDGEWLKENYWLYENEDFDGVCVKIESKGEKAGLKHSDYGVYTEDYVLTPDVLAKTPGYAENIEGNVCHMYNVYAGGNDLSKSFTKPSNAIFKGGAVAQIQETDTYARRLAYADNATLTVDASGNETLDLPFNNWYHVVIVRTANNITLELNNEENVPEQWRPDYNSVFYSPISYENQKNGLQVSYNNGKGGIFETPFTGRLGVLFGDKDKTHDNINPHNVIATIYYGDDPYNPTEAVSQGYQTYRYFIDSKHINGIFFGFAFGGARQR